MKSGAVQLLLLLCLVSQLLSIYHAHDGLARSSPSQPTATAATDQPGKDEDVHDNEIETASTVKVDMSKSAAANCSQIFLVSTLDGRLTAVDQLTGANLWQLNESPVLQVPLGQNVSILPDPVDGSLYALAINRFGRLNSLKKLPYTVADLVHRSPTRGSDGSLCIGSKRDVWLGVDLKSGRKVQHLSLDRTHKLCPHSADSRILFIGRTQYTIAMLEPGGLRQKWNVTYNDYNAHALTEAKDIAATAANLVSVRFLTSSQDGVLVAVDSTTENMLWANKFKSPVVAVYHVLSDVLYRAAALTLSADTLADLLIKLSRGEPLNLQEPRGLQELLYIGSTANGWYALPTVAKGERHLKLSSAPQYPLLEGPNATRIDRLNSSMHSDNESLEDALSGFYDRPQSPRNTGVVPPKQRITDESLDLSHRIIPPPSPTVQGPNHVDDEGAHFSRRRFFEILNANMLTAILCLLMTFVVWNQWKISRNYQHLVEQNSQQNSKDTNSNAKSSSSTAESSSNASQVAISVSAAVNKEGSSWCHVGRISYDPGAVLGTGCEGTVVFRGLFDGRSVAVKRLLPAFFEVADREVELLRVSDQHQNVVRYFCTEQCPQFRYIALELCCCNLTQYAHEARPIEKFGLSPEQVLKQTLCGIRHLHRLGIVHRDVKPHNVLMCRSPLGVVDKCGKSEDNSSMAPYRAVISDFGLCKKLGPGRSSFTKCSGLAGTEGWMAPEMYQEVSGSRMAAAALDVFSAGCLVYYVLSGAQHPFGDPLHRTMNICEGRFRLDRLRRSQFLARHLIVNMLQNKPEHRPSVNGCLQHPFFWTCERQLTFLQQISDRLEHLQPDEKLPLALEWGADEVVMGDWRTHIGPELQQDLCRFRSYQGNRVADLLRAIRNKKHHFRELPSSLQQSLGGGDPKHYMNYFSSHFPLLLVHTYSAAACIRYEAAFQQFYALDDYFEIDQLSVNQLKQVVQISVSPVERSPPQHPRQHPSDSPNWRVQPGITSKKARTRSRVDSSNFQVSAHASAAETESEVDCCEAVTEIQSNFLRDSTHKPVQAVQPLQPLEPLEEAFKKKKKTRRGGGGGSKLKRSAATLPQECNE